LFSVGRAEGMTESSVTNGSSGDGSTANGVEYFLLMERPAAAAAPQHSRSSGSRTTASTSQGGAVGVAAASSLRQQQHHQEILSPISYRDGIDFSEVDGDDELNFPLMHRHPSASTQPQLDDDDEEEDAYNTNNNDPESRLHGSGATTRFSSASRVRRGSTATGNGSAGRRGRRRELTGLNYLNAVAYAVHVVVWWGVGVWGLNGAVSTHWEMTERYVTLVTPATWAANYLWIPIVAAEGAFAAAQMIPDYRSRPVVTTGTAYYFFYTVLLQIAHTVLYSLGYFIASFVTAVLALLSLLSLLLSQQNHSTLSMIGRRNNSSATEYVLFSFPFYLHTGWMILKIVDHFSLLFRFYSSDRGLQVAANIVGLGVLLAVAVYALTRPGGPDFVIPSVILWSYVSTDPAMNSRSRTKERTR
jgi:hypothetical protein